MNRYTYIRREEPPAPVPEPPKLKKTWRTRSKELRSRSQGLGLVASGVLMAFVALFLFNAFGPAPKPLTEQQVNEAIANAMASATPAPAVGIGVYDQILPSLVSIRTQMLKSDGKTEGVGGTGVIIDDAGAILTSLHVVANAVAIEVMFMDGNKSPAVLIGQDPTKDIAVIRAQQLPGPVQPAIMGNPNSLQIGDIAIAVGNPFGLTGSLSQGVISGLGRTFRPPNSSRPMTNMIQFDAAINPGNSGGPLLNRNGEVVGIVTGLVNPTDQDFFIGIGFAVPIDSAAAAAGSPPY